MIKDYQKSTVLATAEVEASEEVFKTGKVTFTSATNNKNEEWTPLVSQYYKF
jgi:hypothetical protein